MSRACLPRKHLAHHAFAPRPGVRTRGVLRSPAAHCEWTPRRAQREHASARNEVATNEGYDVQRDARRRRSDIAEVAFGVTALRGGVGAYLEREWAACMLMCSGGLSSSAPAHRAVETASPLEKATLARSSGPVTTEATTRGECECPRAQTGGEVDGWTRGTS